MGAVRAGLGPAAGRPDAGTGPGRPRLAPELLGCVYVDPPEKAGYDAEVWLWVRASELGSGLDAEPYATAPRWVEERWPFRRVAYPGRELPLDRYEALPDR